MKRVVRIGAWIALALLGLSGCASVDSVATGGDDLGEGKQEFETSAQGGVYRFEYVADGPDGYRTVFWRQREPLSDDASDAKLAANVVRSVFAERFCKALKLPVALAEGSPMPLGKIGMWKANLRCAVPPPEPKKQPEPKKKPEKKPAADEAATTASTSTSGGSSSSTEEAKPSAEAKPKSSKAASTMSGDGPMECTRTATGFECKPKK